ncbi:MAG: FAD-binding oxidoreductase [Vicinamibacterales bacterium]
MALGVATGLARAAQPKASSGSPAARYEAALGSKLVYKDARHYETLRLGTIWNGRKPKRYPLGIVMAESAQDVVAAVKLAKARGWKVTVASGGHSFTASFLRDDALLINLTRLEQIDVDAARSIATISPSTLGNTLGAELAKHGFMTPTAHGVAVGMGGFVLCGGHGWNSRVWGPGCANLRALDVVTADGELIRCDEKNNPDWFWAARGGGPGFFGAAVRYDMAIHPRPTVMKTTIHTFGRDDIGTALTWIRDNLESFPALLETAVVGRLRDGQPVLSFIGTALGYNDEEVDSALKVYDRCPIIRKTVSYRAPFADVIPRMTEEADESNPAGWAQVVDGMWTTAGSAQLVPATLEYFLGHPAPRADAYWSCWGPIQKLDDMAYSIQGNVYMSINCVYDDGQDEKYQDYVASAFRKLEPLAVGSQMNDENMFGRPSARYLSQASADKLEVLRRKYDPDTRFAGFLKG